MRAQRRGLDAPALSGGGGGVGGGGRQGQDQSAAPPSPALTPVLSRGYAPLESWSE